MPCDYSKYPKDWKAISHRIKERDGWQCKLCGLPQYAVFRRDGGQLEIWDDGRRRDNRPYEEKYSVALALARRVSAREGEDYKVCVLTVAHLHDPNPMNVDDSNLAALCQRCHLRHDRHQHAENAGNTRRAKAGQPSLLDLKD